MKLTEPCTNCRGNGICSTCDGTGHEMFNKDGNREQKTYMNGEFILCNCTLSESNGGVGECNHCGGSGNITRNVIDYEDPTLDELENPTIDLDFSPDKEEDFEIGF